eukprot:1463072-Lingulodinium_polyedra.AAC.1
MTEAGHSTELRKLISSSLEEASRSTNRFQGLRISTLNLRYYIAISQEQDYAMFRPRLVEGFPV